MLKGRLFIRFSPLQIRKSLRARENGSSPSDGDACNRGHDQYDGVPAARLSAIIDIYENNRTANLNTGSFDNF